MALRLVPVSPATRPLIAVSSDHHDLGTEALRTLHFPLDTRAGQTLYRPTAQPVPGAPTGHEHEQLLRWRVSPSSAPSTTGVELAGTAPAARMLCASRNDRIARAASGGSRPQLLPALPEQPSVSRCTDLSQTRRTGDDHPRIEPGRCRQLDRRRQIRQRRSGGVGGGHPGSDAPQRDSTAWKQPSIKPAVIRHYQDYTRAMTSGS